MSHDMMSMTNSSTCKMMMMFNTYTIDACFLTEEWHITNNGMFAATCIGVMLLVVVLEVSRRLGKEYDDLLARQFQRRAAEASTRRGRLVLAGGGGGGFPGKDPEQLAAAGGGGGRGPRPAAEHVVFRASALQQLVRAVLHAVTFGLAYIVMLIAMYYNVILLVMIILGAGIGKFLCDWFTRTIVVDAGLVTGGEVDRAQKNGVEEPSVCCG